MRDLRDCIGREAPDNKKPDLLFTQFGLSQKDSRDRMSERFKNFQIIFLFSRNPLRMRSFSSLDAFAPSSMASGSSNSRTG